MKRLCKNKYWELNEDYNIDKILYLLIDRPSEINSHNSFYWLNNKNEFHREYDLPAIVYYCNTVCWYLNSVYEKSIYAIDM